MVEFWEMIGFGLNFTFFTCAFFLFLYFLIKLLRTRKTTREVLPFLSLAIYFLIYGIHKVGYLWYNYLYIEYNVWETSIILDMVLLSALIILGFFLEYALKKTKYFLTLYLIVVSCAYFILIYIFGVPQNIKGMFILILTVPVGIGGLLLYYLVFIKPTSGFLRGRMVLGLLGFILLVCGPMLGFSSITQLFGLDYRQTTILGIIGIIIGIIGLCLIGFGFAAFSTFTDIKWKEKLREIFVISNNNGICLYAFSFEQNIPLEDSDLIAGGFSGIQLLLSEIVKTSESLQLIDYQNVKILLRQGSDATFVLIIKEESTFLHYKLKLFSEEFQTFFKDVLQHWRGEMEIFKPTRALIQKIFELNLK